MLRKRKKLKKTEKINVLVQLLYFAQDFFFGYQTMKKSVSKVLLYQSIAFTLGYSGRKYHQKGPCPVL